MTVVFYLCSECNQRFSFVELTYEKKSERREAACPWCNNRTLVLTHKETVSDGCYHPKRG